MVRAVFAILLLAAAGCAAENPIRKVVTMLQMMQNKVSAEGKAAEELYDRFMCYAKTGDANLNKAIVDANSKITMLESNIQSTAAEKAQLEAEVAKAKADRAAADGAIGAATAQRETEHTKYTKVSTDLKANVKALRAIEKGIEGGMSGGFLQTRSASVLKRLSLEMDLSDYNRNTIASFLSGGSDGGYVPQSQEIVGIMKRMADEMEADLKSVNFGEATYLSSYNDAVAAKNSEIAALAAAIESKLTRLAEAGVELQSMKNELVDTREGLGSDTKFLADLGTSAEAKTAEWKAYKATQAEELAALADTIKFLNDDDALELFKKTLPSAASLVQVRVSTAVVRRRALKALKRAGGPASSRLDLIELALRGKAMGFEKVIAMIDKLVQSLNEEQGADDAKKAYCEAEFDQADDKKKALNKDISDLEKAIDDQQNAIANLKSEIEALEDSIRALDKSVAEATEIRKQEHAAYVEDLTGASTAKDLLGFAKNRLNKFYNPKMYLAPPKRELSEEERITLNMGGTLAPTAPPAGIAGTGIGLAEVSQHESGAPPPPPAANLAYKKSAGSGPIAMIDILLKDLDKQLQEMEVTETDSQGDYEKFMKDSAAERAATSKSMTDNEAAKAATEDELINNQESLRQKKYNKMDTEKYISELHGECDWLLKSFDLRKAARAKEIEALGNAKDVLKGASYSF